MRSAHARVAAVVVHTVVLAGLADGANGGSSFASAVLEYEQGANPSAGFTDELAALGEPTRFTGEGVFPSVVSPFSPPFLTDEIVSIGAGGWITLAFDTPVTDHADNPFGIDFIVFGNVGFIDGDFPNGLVAGMFGNDPYVVEVSADGANWTPLEPATSDVLFPTLGYLDSGPFDAEPGDLLTDFTLPVDPSLTFADLLMLTHAEVVKLYAGSGGGAGFDISSTGFASVTHVRISNPGDPKSTAPVEIDAVARVTPVGSIADFVSSDTFQPPPDGVVDGADLAFLLGEWGDVSKGGSPADIVSSDTFEPPPDGVVDGADLAVLLGEWTS